MKQDVKINPTYEEVKLKDPLPCEEVAPPRYHEYRRKWVENPKNNVVEDFPLNLDLEVTSYCNLRCPMCYRTIADLDASQDPSLGYMDWELYKKCIDEGADYGLYAVKLNYRGEPLLHPQLPEMIAYAKAKGVVDVQFNTNGVLLKGDLARRILDAGVDRVIISFDSIRKERYESIRVGARFEEVVRNVEEFVKLRDKSGRKTPCIRVSMVKMKENLEEVEEFRRFWEERGVDIVSYVNYVNYMGKDPEAEQRYVGRPVRMRDDFVCAQLWQRLFVWCDGRVTPCCGDLEGGERLGDAWKDSLHEIWVGERLQYLRRLHWEGNYKRMKICTTCTLPYTVAVMEEMGWIKQ